MALTDTDDAPDFAPADENDVWEFLGMRRVPFLIGPDGKIAKVYDPVKPAAHAEEVLRDLERLAD